MVGFIGLDPFPWWLNLSALILAMVAFLMAVQPFIQMWVGRPKVLCVFTDVSGMTEQDKLLIGMLLNRPVGKIQAFLGFSRNTIDVTVLCTITEAVSGKEMSSTVALLVSPEDIYAPQRRATRLPVPPSTMGTTFGVLAWIAKYNGAFVDNQWGQHATPLPTGRYTVGVEIDSGYNRQRLERQAIVGDSKDSTFWEKDGH